MTLLNFSERSRRNQVLSEASAVARLPVALNTGQLSMQFWEKLNWSKETVNTRHKSIEDFQESIELSFAPLAQFASQGISFKRKSERSILLLLTPASSVTEISKAEDLLEVKRGFITQALWYLHKEMEEELLKFTNTARSNLLKSKPIFVDQLVSNQDTQMKFQNFSILPVLHV